VQMWKQVGIETDFKVLESAVYFDLAHSDKLEMPVLYAWTNSSGDPELFSGLFMDPKKRNSVWKSDDIPPRLDPLLVELDYNKRMAGYRAFDRWTVEQGYAFPLLLSPATVVHTKRIGYVPYRTGWTLPYAWTLS
jgi:peptide/nickel transport system substrate-binding protein